MARTRTNTAEQILRPENVEDSEAKYKNLFNSIDQGFCVIEMMYDKTGRPTDYRFLETNAVFENQTGLRRAVGKTIRGLVPDFENHWFETYGKVAATGRPKHFIDGSEAMGRWFDVHASRVGGPDSSRVAILFTDITSRKQAETRLLDSEKRFRLMADTVPAMIWITEPGGHCTYLNRRWYEYTGQTTTTGLGLGWLDAVHADDAEESAKIFLRANKKHQSFSLEYRLRDKAGRYRWFLDAGVPKLDESKNFEGYIGMVTEIDDRKQAETALREQLRITEAITSNATVCLFMIDTSGLVTYMNPAAAEVTGYTLVEVVDRPMHSLIHHSRPDGTPYPEKDCPLVRTYRQGKPNPTHEDIFYRKDGRSFPALITGTPIVGAAGVQATVVEFRDLTDEKRSLSREEQLEELTVSLKEQQTQLIALNEAKDEFISLASHQLRTPATGVKQYLGMLMQGYAGDLSEPQMEFLRTANESNERQLRIVNDLLKVARVDSGKLRLQKESTDLKALVVAVINEQMPNFTGSNQRISLVCKASAVAVDIDRTLFRMVLENLIDNAHKYTDAGKSIRVRVQQLRSSVLFSVQDEGTGIAAEDIEKLFQKFSRLDNPFSVSSGGTGLGLYLAKKVVDLHDGSVGIKSELGNGTTFTIKMPISSLI